MMFRAIIIRDVKEVRDPFSIFGNDSEISRIEAEV